MITTHPSTRPFQRRRRQGCAPTLQIFTSFPKRYFTTKKLHGFEIIFRAIQPEDETLLLEFHKTLSDQSVHFRYFSTVSFQQRTLHERLRQHCSIDHTREFALVADLKNASSTHQILGIARLSKALVRDEAEFAIVLSDSWQGKGLGTGLLKLLVRIGRESGLRRVTGHILADNLAMTRVSRKAGFSLRFDSSIGEWLAELRL